jgi:hypothetical protein
MGKLKESMIISEELASAGAEMWEHNVISEAAEFIAIHGADHFRDSLFTFNRDVYNKLFNVEKKTEKSCFLTEKRV